MKLIGENINIISKSLGPAIRERQAAPVQKIARQMKQMDYIDLNIGPAPKDGWQIMPWLIQTVQSVSQQHLCLDTTNPLALEAGLALLPNESLLVNSISLQPERLSTVMPLVSRYQTDVVGLLWGVNGMPRDFNERCMLAVELLLKTAEEGIANEKVWLDPIATPVSGDITQILATVSFLQMLPEIAPGCKSVVGLSNVSNGAPTHLRHYLNAVYLIMLKRYGLYGAIVDCLDEELVAIARGERPQLEQMVHQVMDGQEPSIECGGETEKYFKTALVLNGHSLFSNAWLD